MKKIIILFLAIILVSINSCMAREIEYGIKDALRISAWVVDKSKEEDYWRILDENINQIVEHEDFLLEQLELNKIRIMAPLSWLDMPNLNIFFEFEGVIGVETEGEYIQLSYNEKNPSQPGMGPYGNFKWPLAVYANVCPLDEYSLGGEAIVRNTAKIGCEYYLNISAYRFGNEETPIIRAQLKLVVVEDKISSDDEDIFRVPFKERSRFLSIELVSYEYSDVYRILDEIVDDE